MLLTVDAGNTNINFCVFKNDEIIFSCTLATDINKLEDEYGIIILNLLQNAKLDKELKSCVISSVVTQLDDTLKNAIQKYLKIEVFAINYKIKMPFGIKIDEPKSLGADRIANAAAVALKYPLPVVVIDFGTATTFDVVDKDKNFIGGLIAPGMLLQAKSLGKFTSKLPKIKLEAPKNNIAKNTIDAMLTGIVKGHACMIEGMLKKTEEELGDKATVIVTGGLSGVLLDNVNRKFDYIDKNLTHKGLKILYELNVRK